jgi:hypothetical protein
MPITKLLVKEEEEQLAVGMGMRLKIVHPQQ